MTAPIPVHTRKPGRSEDCLPDHLHPVIRKILLSRGISDSNGMDLGLSRLSPPGTLKGLDEAAVLLSNAIQGDQKNTDRRRF